MTEYLECVQFIASVMFHTESIWQGERKLFGILVVEKHVTHTAWSLSLSFVRSCLVDILDNCCIRTARVWGHSTRQSMEERGTRFRTSPSLFPTSFINLQHPACWTSTFIQITPWASMTTCTRQPFHNRCIAPVSREKTKIHTERSDKLPSVLSGWRGGKGGLCKLCWAVWGGQDEWWTACKLWTVAPTTTTSSPPLHPQRPWVLRRGGGVVNKAVENIYSLVLPSYPEHSWDFCTVTTKQNRLFLRMKHNTDVSV